MTQSCCAGPACAFRSSCGRPDSERTTLRAGDLRAADAAVWRSQDVGRSVGKLRSVPPVLAVEIAGQDEDEQVLREKARWYLDHGAAVIWLVLPEPREVLVIRGSADSRHSAGQRLPETPELPDLAPEVDRCFVQIDRV